MQVLFPGIQRFYRKCVVENLVKQSVTGTLPSDFGNDLRYLLKHNYKTQDKNNIQLPEIYLTSC